MVDLMNLLSDVLIGGFQMLMLNDLGKNMFSYRIKTYWTRILIYGVTVLVILGVNHIESTFINIMMVPVSYTIASIVIFQGSVWKKIILACCYYMLAIVPEFLFAVITGAYGVTGTENNFHSELEKLLSLLLMSTITFLLVKCVNQITRKKNYQTIENKLFTVLLTLPAATIIIFMCIYYSHISFTGVNRIMIPIHHGMLRDVVCESGEQKILKEVPMYLIQTASLVGFEEKVQEEYLTQVRKEMSGQVLNAEKWPLFDLKITIMDKKKSRLHINFDNLILDGWSMFALLDEMAKRYRANEYREKELEISFRDYVISLNEMRKTEKYEKQY